MSEENNKNNTINEHSENNYPAYVRTILTVSRKFASFRPAAYASEVSEAHRPVIPKSIINIGYAISFGYVFADIGLKVHNVKSKGTEVMAYTAFDQTLWHTSASIVVPAVTIHTIVNVVTHGQTYLAQLNKVKLPSRLKYLPTVVGLLSIPLIIHPIDHGTDYVMNNMVRPHYQDKLN
jgi:mitochondrial fission process protein 1